MSFDSVSSGSIDPAVLNSSIVQEPESFLLELKDPDQTAIPKYEQCVSSLESSIEVLLGRQELVKSRGDPRYAIDFPLLFKQAESAISEAVIATKNAQLEKYYPSAVGRFAEVGRPPSSPLQSDDSDVDELDTEDFFKDLSRTLRAFHEDKPRQFWVLKGLTGRQRRHAHAIAHFMRYGHVSVGEGPLRLLLITRDKTRVPAYFKSGLRRLRRERNEADDIFQAMLSPLTPNDLGTTPPQASPYLFTSQDDLSNIDFDNHGSPMMMPVPTSLDMPEFDTIVDGHSTGSASSGWISSGASLGSRKRRRQERQEGQFICLRVGYFEVFDRQCDLSHHERVHLPYEQRPYACEQCEKRFLFPKDLRRHETTHRSSESNSGDGVDHFGGFSIGTNVGKEIS